MFLTRSWIFAANLQKLHFFFRLRLRLSRHMINMIFCKSSCSENVRCNKIYKTPRNFCPIKWVKLAKLLKTLFTSNGACRIKWIYQFIYIALHFTNIGSTRLAEINWSYKHCIRWCNFEVVLVNISFRVSGMSECIWKYACPLH